MGEKIMYIMFGILSVIVLSIFIWLIVCKVYLNKCLTAVIVKKVYITDINGKRLIYNCSKVRIRKNKIYLYPDKDIIAPIKVTVFNLNNIIRYTIVEDW